MLTTGRGSKRGWHAREHRAVAGAGGDLASLSVLRDGHVYHGGEASWCGVVWCGMMWCDVIWPEVNAMIRYDIVDL